MSIQILDYFPNGFLCFFPPLGVILLNCACVYSVSNLFNVKFVCSHCSTSHFIRIIIVKDHRFAIGIIKHGKDCVFKLKFTNMKFFFFCCDSLSLCLSGIANFFYEFPFEILTFDQNKTFDPFRFVIVFTFPEDMGMSSQNPISVISSTRNENWFAV